MPVGETQNIRFKLLFFRKIYMFVSIVFPVAQWSPLNSFSFFNFSPWIERFLEDWDFSLDRYAPINSELQDPPPLHPSIWDLKRLS